MIHEVNMNKDNVLKLLNCNITWKEFSNKEHCSSYVISQSDCPTILVTAKMIENAISAYFSNNYSVSDLIDWANVVRFSDIFTIDEANKDCIISILDRIEESDEDGKILTENDLRNMQAKLKQNRMW